MLPRHLAVGVTCSSDARVGVIEDGLTLRSGPIKPFDPDERAGIAPHARWLCRRDSTLKQAPAMAMGLADHE